MKWLLNKKVEINPPVIRFPRTTQVASNEFNFCVKLIEAKDNLKIESYFMTGYREAPELFQALKELSDKFGHGLVNINNKILENKYKKTAYRFNLDNKTLDIVYSYSCYSLYQVNPEIDLKDSFDNDGNHKGELLAIKMENRRGLYKSSRSRKNLPDPKYIPKEDNICEVIYSIVQSIYLEQKMPSPYFRNSFELNKLKKIIKNDNQVIAYCYKKTN